MVITGLDNYVNQNKNQDKNNDTNTFFNNFVNIFRIQIITIEYV